MSQELEEAFESRVVHEHVIVMAAEKDSLDRWTAYWMAFDKSWDREALERQKAQALQHGEAMPQAWAEAVFPEFAKRYRYINWSLSVR